MAAKLAKLGAGVVRVLGFGEFGRQCPAVELGGEAVTAVHGEVVLIGPVELADELAVRRVFAGL